jgi:transporter family protein
MQQPLVYALVAMVGYGLCDFVYKRGADAGVRADHFLMAQGWLFVPLVIVYAWATHNLVLVSAALWGWLAGVFVLIGFYYFIRSLTIGSVSTNAAIFRLNFIVTVLLVVVFLGEQLTGWKLVGLAFALAATWLLLGGGARRRSETRLHSLTQVGIATVAFGASNFFHTVGLRHGALPETMVVAQSLAFMPLATAVVYAVDRKLAPPPVTFKYAAATSVILLGAQVSLLRGVAAGQASVLVPIGQMGFIVAAMLGVFVLGERITARKAIGLGAALAALAVLAASAG